jgi:hypothetical protein
LPLSRAARHAQKRCALQRLDDPREFAQERPDHPGDLMALRAIDGFGNTDFDLVVDGVQLCGLLLSRNRSPGPLSRPAAQSHAQLPGTFQLARKSRCLRGSVRAGPLLSTADNWAHSVLGVVKLLRLATALSPG